MKINKIHLLLMLVLLSLRSYSQNDLETSNYVGPEFTGGLKAYKKYLGKYLRYPPEEYQTDRIGIVYTTISIDSSGNITDVTTRTKYKMLGDEVKRVFYLMPKWTSGKINGHAIDTSVSRRIYFSVESSRLKDDSTDYEILIYKVPLIGFNDEFDKAEERKKKYEFAKSFYDKGVVELQNNNAVAAIDFFNQAEQQGFHDIDLYYNRGIANFKAGNKEAACQDWLEGARRGDAEALDVYNKKCR